MHFHDFCCWFVNCFHLCLLKTNYLYPVFSSGFAKLFHVVFTSYLVHIMLIFYAFKWKYCRHWKTWWNMSIYVCYALFLHPSIFSLKYSRCTSTINGALSDSWYWLNSKFNFSVFRRYHNIAKSLLSHTFLLQDNAILLCFEYFFFFFKHAKH